MCGGRVATKTCIKSTFVLRTAAAKKPCTTAFQTPTNMHIHHHTSHAASASGALDDAADGRRPSPVRHVLIVAALRPTLIASQALPEPKERASA